MPEDRPDHPLVFPATLALPPEQGSRLSGSHRQLSRTAMSAVVGARSLLPTPSFTPETELRKGAAGCPTLPAPSSASPEAQTQHT